MTDQKKDATLTPNSDTKPVTVEVKCPTPDEVTISYDTNAKESAMSAKALTTLRDICSKACISSVIISSTARTATDQARIMYDMLMAHGAAYGNDLYGGPGKEVIKVWEAAQKDKLSADDTKKKMLDEINKQGPSNVSHHVVSDDGKLCTFDVAPSSVGSEEAKKRFVKEVQANSNVQTFYQPPKDPGFHLEVPS